MTWNNRSRAAVVLVILVITLAPSGNHNSEPFSFCVACGPRGLADGILNLLLFVPLGCVLGWSSRPPITALLVGVILSITIELAQVVIPGRDPSLSDIVFNTLGTGVGVALSQRPNTRLFPGRKTSLLLVLLSLATIASALVATGFLLGPANSSFSVARSGEDLSVRYTARASEIGLDQPDVWLPGAFRGGPDAHGAVVSVRRERSHWDVSIGANTVATIGPTIGEGWALLAYPDAIGRRWSTALSELWILCLCVPIGFWARGHLLLIVFALIAGLLLLIPSVTGVVSVSAREWTGATLGLLLGASLSILANRRWGLPASE